MRVRKLELGALGTNCWLVDDDAGGDLIVIDPADESGELEGAIGRQPVGVIVLTHGHFDHLGAATELVRASGAPLAIHRLDAHRITHPEGTGGSLFGFPHHTAPPADRLLEDGDEVVAGGVSLAVLHTPGHTEGSICLLAPGHLFSGDTIFAGSVGRTDFPGGDARALARSIAERLVALPDDTLVHPGHGPDSTMGREKRLNPFFPRA